ncbi:bifunctional aminoglycoside phosphotransferase/ATP-binding protein [Salinicola avicenniae]|uniref:bifunctional aminoglycoside phosphotransferase/ATP-binding protein n=1 Tax=Salinicola avicenniae TaxID=2916836 RepID=UPI002073E066|nr:MULTISPECIES: bifunctional aminoglycoside phosphotransferase/ATP-binding protein [unclassified Salinicola]
MSRTLIQALKESDCFDHPIGAVEVFETPISWVVLTGDYAYKIKKPLDYGSFLDFSTLEKRRQLCEQEVALNRRVAPALYLGCVAISGSETAPRVNDDSAPIEYAVKMRQFSSRHLLSSLQASGELSAELIDDVVDQLVALHESAARIDDDSPYGSPAHTQQMLVEEFELIESLLETPQDREALDCVKTLTLESFARLEPILASRRRDGFIRESHGDIHLGNAVRFEGKAILFNGIEFNERLRWCDVACELAFLVMDLEARGEREFAHYAINRYLELSGDYQAVQLLNFYKRYRALLRARIELVRDRDAGRIDDLPEEEPIQVFRRYLEMAREYSEFRFPYLIMAVGVSGSGKSRFTEEIVRRLGGVRLRSDVERKRLFDFTAVPDDADAVYSEATTDQTYRRLAALAGMVLESGLPACIDATCLRRAQRDRLRFEAEKRGLPVLIVSFEADQATLRARIVKRARRSGEPSERSLAILEQQLARFEPFGSDETTHLVHLDTTAPDANLTLASLIQERMRLN